MDRLKRTLRYLIERLETVFDAVFTPRWNPMYHLGALGWFYYWIVAVSGLYLYIFFDSGIDEAYNSVEYLTHTQWYAGGVMRSLHRYASDALVLVVLLHLVREFSKDRMRGPRGFAWITGVPLIWLIYASGISGYWVVWDKLAQYVALTTSEWLDTLPLFGEPIARNFLHDSTLSGRFFSLMVFIHIAVPLILLFLMWVHIQRHAHPRVNPPKGLALGTLISMVVLSLAYPALSQGPADMAAVPAVVGLDWFYLTLYPLLDWIEGQWLWLFLILGTALLAALPWLPRQRGLVPAKVDLDNCNGCGRCVADCPFSAVVLAPRTDGMAFAQEAQVLDTKCVDCGICAGACPTATPFRRRSDYLPGIDLPRLPLIDVRKQVMDFGDQLTGSARVAVFGCETGPDLDILQSDQVGVVRLRCLGQLPPSFIDFALSRRYVDGVVLTGCRDGDCIYRLGQLWTEQRLARVRDPHMRRRVNAERVYWYRAGIDRGRGLSQELDAFRERLLGLNSAQTVEGRSPETADKTSDASVKGDEVHA